jgi:hypothetical protein
MNTTKKSTTILLLSGVLLAILPTLSYSDCADLKERYWRCTRASMIGEKCAAEDNVTIPPECLNGGGNANEESRNTTGSSSNSNSTSGKTTRPFIYPESEPELVAKKPVKVVNIRALNTKNYIETEEDVEQFVNKVKTELLDGIEEGKKVRLQFN